MVAALSERPGPNLRHRDKCTLGARSPRACVRAWVRGCVSVIRAAESVCVMRRAAVNTQDADGWTPVMHAASSGDAESVAKYVASGADLTIRNKVIQSTGRRPLPAGAFLMC